MKRLTSKHWVTESDHGRFEIVKHSKGEYAVYENVPYVTESGDGDVQCVHKKTFTAKPAAVKYISEQQGGTSRKSSSKKGKFDFEKEQGLHYIIAKSAEKSKWEPVDQSGGSTSAEAAAKRLRENSTWHEVKVVSGREYYEMLDRKEVLSAH
ncbi:hypothetical protein [Streptomyces sp. CoH17]|uniref:hypothetical protein n=1 Tax=Streptomyces sp. CoH17 TaxID=2992806 RepID=UPI002271735F|nr:hypothetical protein [Streptomyces sp. CoH17]